MVKSRESFAYHLMTKSELESIQKGIAEAVAKAIPPSSVLPVMPPVDMASPTKTPVPAWAMAAMTGLLVFLATEVFSQFRNAPVDIVKMDTRVETNEEKLKELVTLKSQIPELKNSVDHLSSQLSVMSLDLKSDGGRFTKEDGRELRAYEARERLLVMQEVEEIQEELAVRSDYMKRSDNETRSLDLRIRDLERTLKDLTGSSKR